LQFELLHLTLSFDIENKSHFPQLRESMFLINVTECACSIF